MKHYSFSGSLAALIASAWLAAPVASYADHKVTVYRDQDRDGHYNKKTYDYSHHNYGGRYGRGYYGGGYSRGYYGGGYGRGYYGHSYYGGGYGYRPRYYGSYYSPYYYSGPSVGLSFYSSPDYYSGDYYSDSTVYRGVPRYSGSSYEDSLAADVQRALKRRGYYRGDIDGDIGPGSRSAIRAYQADRGLTVTGRIDRSLLQALGIG